MPARPPDESARPGNIRIHGARQHNLRDLHVELPLGRLTVITGPSGSGKSSLAVDVLYAEGQRQFVETLAPHARRHIAQLPRPDVDFVESLPPTLCIDQHRGPPTPRSTVGTLTEINDYLRVLVARVGVMHCPQCGEPIEALTVEGILQRIAARPLGERFMILAPLVRRRRGAQAEAVETIRKAGLVRARIDGALLDIDASGPLDPRQAHSIEGVVDRLKVERDPSTRLTDSIQLALRLGNGALILSWPVPASSKQAAGEGSGGVDEYLSTRSACLKCDRSVPPVDASGLSFNSPQGACEACEGLGELEQFALEAVIPDIARSLRDGAIAPYRSLPAKACHQRLEAISELLRMVAVGVDWPVKDWPTGALQKLFVGSDGHLGLQTLLDKELATATDERRLNELCRYRAAVPCSKCGGSRLNEVARSMRLAGRGIDAWARLSVDKFLKEFEGLAWSPTQAAVAAPLASEIAARMKYLQWVGLGYLTLDRATQSLSGGEYQRARLATAIGTGLAGACYVLDEPTVGLHPRDGVRLIEAVRRLKERGQTVVVVEHDEEFMRAADHIVDLGPGAGRNGGRVLATGTPDEIARIPCATGPFLAGQRRVTRAVSAQPVGSGGEIVIEGARGHNLKNLCVSIPLNKLVCVTGVSGSGKSTLVQETLVPGVARALGESIASTQPFDALHIRGRLTRVLLADQKPIGRSPRSIPATYLGIWNDIRRVFALTKDARRLGYRVERFSFNSAAGWCPSCRGHGVRRVEMNFLPDWYMVCPACEGKRFNGAVRQVRFRDCSISDVLELSAADALEIFESFPRIVGPLQAVSDVGLAYLTLGRSTTTLSGGEAQRLRLAAELARREAEPSLFVFDEPTTGLHFVDVQHLLDVLDQLVRQGHSVVVVEHHLDVIRWSDWVVDLGPEGGSAGGRLVAEGTPQTIAQCENSHTGQYLRQRLAQTA